MSKPKPQAKPEKVEVLDDRDVEVSPSLADFEQWVQDNPEAAATLDLDKVRAAFVRWAQWK